MVSCVFIWRDHAIGEMSNKKFLHASLAFFEFYRVHFDAKKYWSVRRSILGLFSTSVKVCAI